MTGQKRKELPDIAGIGVERFPRHAPLAAEIIEPAPDFGVHVTGGGKSAIHMRDLGRGSLPFLKCPESGHIS